MRFNPNQVVEDNYYVDWGDYPAIILVICSFFTAVFLALVLVFILATVCTTAIKETSISFHVVQLSSMVVSCFIIYIFIGNTIIVFIGGAQLFYLCFLGTPSDGYCALRPWTSIFFTLVFGNLVAKQMAMTIQSIRNKFKKDDESVMHVKYNPLYLSLILVPFLLANLLYLILWTAIDYPKAGSYSASGQYNSQV